MKQQTLIILLSLLLWNTAYSSACPRGDVKSYLKTHDVKRLVFFASWCDSCKAKLADPQEGDLFLGVYDSIEKVERVGKFFHLQGRCFFDESLYKEFGLDSLPTVIERERFSEVIFR